MIDKDVDPASLVRPVDVDPEATLTVVRIPREWAKWRLDRVVHATFPRLSRTRARTVVEAGAFSGAGKRLRPNDRVRFGDVVCLWRAPFDEPEVPTEIPILFEDDHLLVVDKPAGLPVHPTARYQRNTLVTLLAKARPDAFLGLCHRIDKETSGAIVLAKDPASERFIKRALEAHVVASLDGSLARAVDGSAGSGVAKRYLCITWGVPSPPDGRIVAPLALDEHHRFRVKMRVARADDPAALSAATRYRVLGVRRRAEGRSYALVACDLETGRQHQIRAHLASIGAPIVGDKLYGGDGDWDELFGRGADGTLDEADHARLELPRHALHAHRIALPHPSPPSDDRRLLVVESPLPPDLAAFWEQLVDVVM